MSRWRLLDAVLGRLTFCTCTHPGRRLTRPSVGLRGGPVRCLKIVTTSWVYRFSSRCSARSSRLASQGGHLGPKGARAPRSRAFKVCSVRIYYKSQESSATYSCNKPSVTSSRPPGLADSGCWHRSRVPRVLVRAPRPSAVVSSRGLLRRRCAAFAAPRGCRTSRPMSSNV